MTQINQPYAVEREFGFELNEDALAGLLKVGDFESTFLTRVGGL